MIILLFYILINQSSADDIIFRLDSSIPGSNNAIAQFPPGSAGGAGDGKLIQFVYDHNFTTNFYLEGAAGYRSPQDIFEYSNMAYELSPGLKVQYGAFIMKLSEGASYMPGNSRYAYNDTNFVTHLSLGLRDTKTRVGIYLDRVHYSNGYALGNPALNYTGFMFSIPIGRDK